MPTETFTPTAHAYPMLGVLGGMGPLATVDFLRKLIEATPAELDQQHLPLVVRFCPEVPDRMAALAGRGPSPEPALVRAARALQDAGATCLVMPCNTAHAWHGAIEAALAIPSLHIVEAAVAAAATQGHGRRLGLLATRGTLAAGLYRQGRGAAIDWVEPSAQELDDWVMPGIRAVKAQQLGQAQILFTQAARALVDRGAPALMLACTEIPIALPQAAAGVPLVDATAALARAAVAWALARGARS